jgi:hypothetical protein
MALQGFARYPRNALSPCYYTSITEQGPVPLIPYGYKVQTGKLQWNWKRSHATTRATIKSTG